MNTPDGTVDEMPLAERIEILADLCADPPVDADVPELTGLLGEAYLDRYDVDGDVDLLTLAIGRIEQALTSAPAHPDALRWRYRLGLAYAERADRARDVADYGHAIELLEVVFEALPEGDFDRDLTAVVLADAHWDRFRTVRAFESRAPDAVLGDARRTAATVGLLAAAVHDEELAAYGRLVQGCALIAVSDASDRRPDLDAAIAVLAEAFRGVDAGTPRFVMAGAELCFAYRQRARLDDDPADLALAVQVGQRAADTCAEDDPAVGMLYDFLAAAYQDRWDADEDPADLDRAIDCWRRTHAYEPDGLALGLCGYLLRERGERTGTLADVDEAVGLLERAVAEPADDHDTMARWYDLGQAYHAQWRLGRTPGSLDRAAACLDRLAAMDLPADDRLLSVHNERMSITYDLTELESARTPAEPPPSAARMPGELAAARAAWERCAGESTELGRMFAAMLGAWEFYGASFDLDSVDLDRVSRMLAIGRTVAEPASDWLQFLDAMDALVAYVVDAQRPAGRPDGGLEPLVRAAGGPDTGTEISALLRRVMPMILQARAARSGDQRALQAAKLGFAAGAAEGADDPASLDTELVLTGDILAVLERALRGDVSGAAADADRLWTSLTTQPLSFRMQQSMLPFLGTLRQVFAGRGGMPLTLDRTPFTMSAGIGGYLKLGQALVATAGPLTAAVTRHDLPALRECAAHVGELAGHAPPGHFIRLMAVNIAARAELEVARHDRGDRSAARRAVAWSAEATELARGPDHPLWGQIAMCHGAALRLAGDPDRARSRQLGLSALRAHVWQVMIQSGTDDAVASASSAAADALEVAGWCREDGAHHDLLTALDAGRGLVLHAATTSRHVADQLVDAGRPDLAEQWRDSAGFGRDALTGAPLEHLSTGPEVPDDLRARVLQVLGVDDPVHGGTFTAVRSEEVRAALGTVGADALVYLIPATSTQSGAAVIVPARDAMDTIVLPELVVHPGTAIGRHVAAGGAYRDADPVDEPSGPPPPSIDAVCRWAWSAAMADVLRYAARWHLPRPVRLVLVPVGVLALVPWHAAYRQDATGRHYAVEQAVFSYAVSARTLCASAQHPARPIRSALVVGDPDGTLPFAGTEARAVHDAFYPDATYLGRSEGTGTPDEILQWIDTAASGSSMMHLACHGHTDPTDPLGAHLALAGGTLTARRLLDHTRLAELVIDRVFLAACTTSVASGAYDEAFSLSTAFLAAGARTVFGSLWSVPDAETSLLMYLVHHYLNVESYAPVDALHRAQLWMLDPLRRAPAGMPPELARHCSGARPAEPLSWAAFTHQGR